MPASTKIVAFSARTERSGNLPRLYESGKHVIDHLFTIHNFEYAVSCSLSDIPIVFSDEYSGEYNMCGLSSIVLSTFASCLLNRTSQLLAGSKADVRRR